MDYKKKIIELLEKADHDQYIQFSDLFVAFCELNKTIRGGGLLPFLYQTMERRNINGKKKTNRQQGPCIENRRKSG